MITGKREQERPPRPRAPTPGPPSPAPHAVPPLSRRQSAHSLFRRADRASLAVSRMLCTHTAAVKRRMDSGKWTAANGPGGQLLRTPRSAATTATPSASALRSRVHEGLAVARWSAMTWRTTVYSAQACPRQPHRCAALRPRDGGALRRRLTRDPTRRSPAAVARHLGPLSHSSVRSTGCPAGADPCSGPSPQRRRR